MRLFLSAAVLALGAVPTTPLPGAEVTFEQAIRPILKAYCLDCHGGSETLEGNLDLRLRRFAVKGGDSGPALVPGDPAASRLLARMKAGEMPPGEKKVPADQVAILEQWISQGAAARTDEPEQLAPGINITPEDRAYWFYQPIQRVEPPTFASEDRVRTPIDAFLLATMREKGLSFAPDADRRVLILRAALDLTGLPPTQEQLDQFLADTREGAYERMLETFLQTTQYGERWGRHWLDVAGYADSEGDGTQDTPRPHAFRYRDYVIRAIAADKPFNQFLIEQLAGDELIPQPWSNLTPEQIDVLSATGFLRTAIDETQGTSNEQEPANQVIADTLKVVSSSLLGLTVGCAQCHDHRYDPIQQTDYFRLRAVFAPALNTEQWRRPSQRLVSLYTDEDRAKAAAIDAEVAEAQKAVAAKTKGFLAKAFDEQLQKFPEDQRPALRAAYEAPADQRTPEQKQLLDANPSANITAGVLYQYDEKAADELKKDNEQIAAKQQQKKPEEFVPVLSEVPGVIPATYLFHRGDYRQPKQAITPGDLTIASAEGARFEIPIDDPAIPTSGRRLAYAKHLTSGSHPLVGRVLVNRIWMHHFGHGLVDSPGDFGMLGTLPSHPVLLDWLASEFVQRGWSLKAMHRLIMTSTAYRQSSLRSETSLAVDQDNRLLSHFPLQRLDAETIRDRMLRVAGKLDLTTFGPPIAVEEDFVGQVVPMGNSARRSVYLQVRRTKPISFLTAFDAPVMTVNCEKRVASTTASQSLVLMNSDFVLSQAETLAQRVRAETTATFARDLVATVEPMYARPSDAWSYGFGAFDESTQRVARFQPLVHWSGTNWQSSATLPDPEHGWVFLRSTGGHTGTNPDHAAVRRWTAPVAGMLTITGKLQHDSENGDGVRGRIVSSRLGPAGSWSVKNGEAATEVSNLAVEAGDQIDLVVDCVENVSSDSFTWPIDLTLTTSSGPNVRRWNATTDFLSPNAASIPQQVAYAWHATYLRLPTPDELVAASAFVSEQMSQLRAASATGDHELAAMTSLAQQLLSSNEFLYVE